MHHATSLNLASVLEHQARLTPERIAITFADSHMTYSEVDARASQIANGLAALGIGPGDHVALSCPNVPWFPLAYFGILKAGGVVVPLNVLLKPREIAYHLKDSDAKAMLAFEGSAELPLASMARAGCDQAGCAHLVILTADPAAPSPVPSALSIAQVTASQPRAIESRRRRPDDTAVILYTSGTTGHPKGAELTHDNMLLNAVSTCDMLLPGLAGGGEQNVTLITLPLFHSTAQTCQMNAGFYGGFRTVLLPRFEPAVVLETIRREKVGFWLGVPTMYWALMQYVSASGMDPAPVAEHLRICASGGAPLPVELLRRFEGTFGVRVLEGYGLSETSPVVCFNQLQRPSKPGTVGPPIFGVDVRSVDEEAMPVARGQRGEIVVRGPNVMKGYYNRPEATLEVMRNGWFHTGDIGIIDEDGYVSIVDRKKDMILRGGFNVYPRELEEVLMTHPAISLVAVVGVPDERLGEEVKAFVVRKPGATLTESELLDWCREQFAAYKYPRSVEFRDALPVNATGKVLKRELRGN
ncbi:MAG: long-chain-fatty-acid--CoA ligase [Acidobacteria bacterium RIFCSPLOWO2_02_FULL_67_36]|nr:MAG: long-chain-fatty-acid--CoA ligase [Acidobacteria bacterium RIFCSPLOWO2_02_FULL_67_36]OFW23815.1 MAG: long-chain-fatty-acid--CoA ligase [Acidobacteria bacterium RIFCSPLOWO2_12_FULL_66_21]